MKAIKNISKSGPGLKELLGRQIDYFSTFASYNFVELSKFSLIEIKPSL